MTFINYAIPIFFLLTLATAAAPAITNGGWMVGDVYVYANGCRTEIAMNAAVEHFKYSPEQQFLNPECFNIPRYIPLRLVRYVRTIQGDAQELTMWEAVDLMRETVYTLLPSRQSVIYQEQSI